MSELMESVLTYSHYEHSPHPSVTDMSRVVTPLFSCHSVFHCSFLLNCFYLAGSLHGMKHDRNIEPFKDIFVFLYWSTY